MQDAVDDAVFISLRKACLRMGVSYSAGRRMAAGESPYPFPVPVTRVGRKYKVRAADIDRLGTAEPTQS